MTDDIPHRFAILGGGPAGNSAATIAASLGAKVTLIEDAVVGGAAHVWDCIPSKAMVATSMRLHAIHNAARLGVEVEDGITPDMAKIATRLDTISGSVASGVEEMLRSQHVEIIRGRGRFAGPSTITAQTEDGDVEVEFDAALIATGSRPWQPDWADVDGERILTTRHAYDLPDLPEHLVIIGAGVTGVEFVHIFSSMGSQVTLVVSRQQVLPHRDAEVAFVLEDDFLERGVTLVKGTRATRALRSEHGATVETQDGRRLEGSHVLLAVGARPNSEDLGLAEAGVATEGGYVTVDEYQRTSVPNVYAAGDVTGQMPLSSVAAMQGRMVARHVMGYRVRPLDYGKMAHAVFTEPEIASVGLEEVDAASEGRKVRITKVPFAANSRAHIQGNTRGFVKVISDPATHEVLGGTIVGHHASELIAILALAVQAHLKVHNLVETLMVYPSLAESLMDAAD